jgi:hypothetical protein
MLRSRIGWLLQVNRMLRSRIGLRNKRLGFVFDIEEEITGFWMLLLLTLTLLSANMSTRFKLLWLESGVLPTGTRAWELTGSALKKSSPLSRSMLGLTAGAAWDFGGLDDRGTGSANCSNGVRFLTSSEDLIGYNVNNNVRKASQLKDNKGYKQSF